MKTSARIVSTPRPALVALVVVLLWPSLVLAAGVQALFDIEAPTGGPFPSDRFTVADPQQKTGRLVSLPQPNCATRPSDCADVDVINTLDGFNLQPRLSIPFDGDIDVSTVHSQTVFLVSLGSTLPGGASGGKIVGINQIVWDVATKTLHVESDELLDQHTRYGLIVTRGVTDLLGDPVEPGAFGRFRHDLNFGQTKDRALKAYRKDLLDALEAGETFAGVPTADVVAASVFTTQSTTSVLEKIRDQLKSETPAPARFDLGAGGTRTVFSRSTVVAITFTRQGVTPANVLVPISALGTTGAVGTLAFGKYRSPDYRDQAGAFIPPVATGPGIPQVQATNDVFFNLFVPSGPKPPGGWPVAIFGHGLTDNKNNGPFGVAAIMASNGIATIAINVVGHGRGPGSTLTVLRTAGPVTFPAGGRGVDQNLDGLIDSTEGINALPPRAIVSSRDGLRQTVVDLMQLVRVLEVGMDVDGDGLADLDPARIYYFGQSLGGIYGTILLAVEPSVRAGVPNVPGGPFIEIARLSPIFRPLLGASLFARVPSLLNDGPPDPATSTFPFIENMPLRDQPPVVNAVPGAMAIQQVIENTEWVSQSGNPVAYAPHLRKDPLDGQLPKPVIYQFALGDQAAPNPTTTAILRAGDLADRTTFFRNDLAFAADSHFPKNPHTFLTNLSPLPAFLNVTLAALAAQQQIATFFTSDGTVITDPDGVLPFFEVPIAGPLPEDLGFIP
jgi:Bacterial virulence factor lipase N-terminal